MTERFHAAAAASISFCQTHADQLDRQRERSDRMTNKNTRYLLTRFMPVFLFFLCVSFAGTLAVKADANTGQSEKKAQYSADTQLDPFMNGMKYSDVIYNNTNGLPTSEANDISQTKEGFIWIGGYGGLVRYDGETFEKIPLDGITGVESLFTDSQNRLWIGSSNSGIAMMKNGVIHYWNDKKDFHTGAVHAIAEDKNGIVYIATTHGAFFIDQDLNMKKLDDERVNDKYIRDLRTSFDGLVYGLDGDGYVFTATDGTINQYGYSTLSDTTCLLPCPKQTGHVYVCNRYSQVYGEFDKNGSMKILDSYDNLLPYVQDIGYSDGLIWYCTRTGIYACSSDDIKKCYDLTNVSLNSSICAFMRDYQGNYWFASSRQGVMKIIPNAFVDLYKRNDFSEDVVNSTCLYKDVLFAATDTGIRVINEYDAENSFLNNWYDYDIFAETGTTRIRSVNKDSRNKLWFSTWGNGLYCFEGKKMSKYSEKTGLSSDLVRTVKEKKDGSVIAIGSEGLDIIRDGKVTGSYGSDEGLVNTSLLCVEEGDNGDMLTGSNGGGIYIIDKNGSVRNLGKKDGLTSDVVMRIKRDRTRNLYWIVTGDSIACMTADYKITTVTNFPYPNNYDIFQNSKDDMWILSSNGIYVVPTEKMIGNEKMTPVYYGIANGLTRIATANSFSELTPDGDLYISGNTGVTKVNIETAFREAPEIRAAVTSIDADGKSIFPDENGSFKLSSKVKKITVHSHVFNYSLITPQKSYRLEGFDDSFIKVNDSGLVPVDYTNLHGGNYRFVLKVTDNNGEIYTTADVNIIKEKAFYEEVWFYIVLGLFILFVFAVTLQMIWMARIKKLQQKHKEEFEKERINTELETARKIQTGTMPTVFPPFPDRTEFDIFASMDPAKEVGGDFYDFFMTDDDHLCMVIADVSGKGIPAALFMMSAKIMISDFAGTEKSPAEILTAVNTKLGVNNPQKMFVTVWLGILEISTGKLTAANAGHEYPVIMQPNGKFEILKDKHGPMICFMKKFRYREYELELKPGAKLFLYTDGVAEATDDSQQMFGLDRLLAALNSQPDISAEQILKNVRSAVDSFVGDSEQFDDLTMMCLEYKKQDQHIAL